MPHACMHVPPVSRLRILQQCHWVNTVIFCSWETEPALGLCYQKQTSDWDVFRVSFIEETKQSLTDMLFSIGDIPVAKHCFTLSKHWTTVITRSNFVHLCILWCNRALATGNLPVINIWSFSQKSHWVNFKCSGFLSITSSTAWVLLLSTALIVA